MSVGGATTPSLMVMPTPMRSSMPSTTPTPSPIAPATRPSADPEPHCVLEAWDTGRKAWVADTVAHRTIAEAIAAASDRGIYRIVLVSRGGRLELEVFAVVGETASATERLPRDTRTKGAGSSGHMR